MTLSIKNYFQGDEPITVDYSNFTISLNYGSGLGLSSGQLVNTGVLSLQGSTGALSLTAGAGISISGLTISNTGIISASGGNGISVSGTDPLTISMTGSYIGNFTVSGTLTAQSNTTPFSSDSSGVGFFVDMSGMTRGVNYIGYEIAPHAPAFIALQDNNTQYGAFLAENYGYGLLGVMNASSSSFSAGASQTIGANTYSYSLAFAPNGYVATASNSETLGNNTGPSIRNVLDNGSGDMSVTGSLSVSGSLTILNSTTGFDGEIFSYNNNITLADSVSNGYAGSMKFEVGGTALFEIPIQYDTSSAGSINNAYFGFYSYPLSEYFMAFNVYSGEVFTATSDPASPRNVLDDGSGNMSVAGTLSVANGGSYGGGLTVAGTIASANVSPANIQIWNSGDGSVGSVIHDTYATQYFGFYNSNTSSTEDGISAGYLNAYFAVSNNNGNGAVGTMAMKYSGLSWQEPPSWRNVLDDGSGNMSVASSLAVGNSSWNIGNTGMVYHPDIELWRDASNEFGLILLEGYHEGIFALGNRSSSTQTSYSFGGSGLASGYAVYPLVITTAGGVFTSGTTNNSTTGAVTPTPRNVLDDGSGNMSIVGNLSVAGEISGGSYNLSGGNGISVSGTTISMSGSYSGQFNINSSFSSTSGTYLNSLVYEVNGTPRFYNQVYASEGTTVNASGDYWFVGWSATGAQQLKVYGSGDVSIGGNLSVSGGISGSSYNLSGGNGISFSTTTISMSGSYSGNMSISGNLSVLEGIKIPVNSGSGGIIIGNSNNDLEYANAGLLLSNTYGSSTSEDNYTQFLTSSQVINGITGDFLSLAINNVGILFAMNFNGDIGITGGLNASGEISGGSYNLSGGNGISFSGTTISMSGSYSGGLGISNGQITISAGSQNTPYNSYATLNLRGNGSANSYGLLLLENEGVGTTFISTTSNSTTLFNNQNDTQAVAYQWNVGASDTGNGQDGTSIMTLSPSGNLSVSGEISGGSYNLSGGNGISFSGTTISMSGSYSGNLSVSGNITAQYINANINNDNPNGSTPTMVLSIYGGGEGSEPSGNYGITISNSTLGFASAGSFAWFEGTTQIAQLNSSGDFYIAGILSTQSNTTPFSSNSSGVGFFVDITGLGRGVNYIGYKISPYAPAFIALQDNNTQYGAFLTEDYGYGLIGVMNASSSSYTPRASQTIDANTYSYCIAFAPNGYVATASNSESLGTNASPSIRNVLDDGSGNMSIAGNFSLSGYITNNWGTFGGTGVNGYFASTMIGAVSVNSGYNFVNSTPYNMLVYWSERGNGTVGNPTTSSGLTILSSGYSSWGVLASGGAIMFNYGNTWNYNWFCLG